MREKGAERRHREKFIVQIEIGIRDRSFGRQEGETEKDNHQRKERELERYSCRVPYLNVRKREKLQRKIKVREMRTGPGIETDRGAEPAGETKKRQGQKQKVRKKVTELKKEQYMYCTVYSTVYQWDRERGQRTEKGKRR